MSDHRKWWSPALGQDMELKVYGHAGKPVLVFPSGGGRFFEFEDFGMVEACRPFLEQGRVRLFAVDSVDRQSWYNPSLSPADRARRHDQYEGYLLGEVLPLARALCGPDSLLLTTGCSMGAYHAVNFLLRHAEVCDAAIALSGLYGHEFVFGPRMDPAVYFHFPLAYLPGLEDRRVLDLLRRARIVVAVGQGAWEACGQYDCIRDTRALHAALEAKGIPAWVDYWGHDVDHDWVWWRRQMPYFLERVLT